MWLICAQCGVNDFTFTDLTKPTHDRLVKVFSYLINFVRFRESQTPIIDEHFNKTEKTKTRIDELFAENQEMEQRLAEMRQEQQINEVQVREKVARNDELKARLLELGREQSRVAENLDRVKNDRARRQQQLEEKTERTVRSRQEAEKLRPYVLESPVTLQSSLTELAENLMREKAQIDAMEKRARALQTSSDSFTVVSNDVQACVKLLDDISTEIQKEDEEESRAARNKEAISDRGASVREVEQTEKLLQRQLARWNERIEHLRKNAQEKAELAQARMEELRNVQRQLREERAEKQSDMERRRIRIEQTEKKVRFLNLFEFRICADLLISRWWISRRTSRARSKQPTTSISSWSHILSSISQRWKSPCEASSFVTFCMDSGVQRAALGYPGTCSFPWSFIILQCFALFIHQSTLVSFQILVSSSKLNHLWATCLMDTPCPPQFPSSRIRTEPFNKGIWVSHNRPPQLALEGLTALIHSQRSKSISAREAASTAAAKVLESP